MDGEVLDFIEERVSCCPDNAYVDTILELFEINEQIGEDLLKDDILTLKFDFLIEAKPLWSRIESYRYLKFEDMESVLTEIPEMNIDQQYESLTACCPFKSAFADLYGNKTLSDVSLRAGTKSLPAHKNVLGIRSPVFKAMFTQDMKEKASKIVDIPDFNADTVDHLLLYIYKDTVADLKWESAMDLYRAADKYQLLDLRKKCSIILKSNISTASVCSIMLLADMHDDINLRKTTEHFISEHDNEIFNSDQWKNFKKENFQLVIETMERVIVHRKYD